MQLDAFIIPDFYTFDIFSIPGNNGISHLQSFDIVPGIGHSLKASEVETREERDALQESALRNFQVTTFLLLLVVVSLPELVVLQLSVEADPGDHLAHFYLGLFMARQRRISEAHSHAQRALQLQPSHLGSLHLAILGS